MIRRWIHEHAVTAVFLCMVAMFAGTSYRLAQDRSNIQQLVSDNIALTLTQAHNDCLQRNETKKTVSALVDVIITSPLVTEERRMVYAALQEQLHQETCPALPKENNH